MALYNWPFYPFILAVGHQLSGLHFQTVGHLWAIICFSLSAAVFVLILKEAGGNLKVMLAGLMLFIASPDLVADNVPKIVREHGFWVFLLLGLWCLVRFYTSNQFRYALCWGVTLVLATLFRIEGISFLLITPFALFFQSTRAWKTRFAMFFKAQSILLGSLFILGTLYFNHSLSADDMGRLYEPVNIIAKAFHEITEGLNDKAHIYGTQVLGEWIDDCALAGLLLTLCWVVLSKVFITAGIAQSLLFCISAFSNHISSRLYAGPIFMFFAMVGFINSIFILLNNYLLQARMTSPLAFAIQIYAAFGLLELYLNFQETRKKKVLISLVIITLLLSGQFGKTLWPPDSGDRYEIDATKWVESHKKPHDKVFYSSNRLRYYAGEYHASESLGWEGVQKLFAQNDIKNYNFIVVNISQKNPEQLKYLYAQLGKAIVQFDNGRKNSVLIYHLNVGKSLTN